MMRAAMWLCLTAALATAQMPPFGGSPPWGLEQPTKFKGALQSGEGFGKAIGKGLSLEIRPDGEGEWEIVVTSSEGPYEDYSRCVNPPFHGPHPKHLMAWHFEPDRETSPGGVGEKRWLEFVLTAEDNEAECHALDTRLYRPTEPSGWGTRISGRCWVRPLTVNLGGEPPYIDSFTFDGECGLYGALELWRRPAVYVIPDGFTGWVTVLYRLKGEPKLPRKGDAYVVDFTKSSTVRTSSDLRQDQRAAEFVLSPGRKIWGWAVGDADLCSPYQTFFVGTEAQFHAQPDNPALKSIRWDCSKQIRARR